MKSKGGERELYALLLLVGTAISVVAIQQISSVPNIFVINGIGPLYSNNTVTFQCSPSDTSGGVEQEFQIAGNDGTQHTVKITCQPTDHLYLINTVGFTMYDGQLQRIVYCVVQSDFNWNDTAGGQYLDPAGRRLLEVSPDGTISDPEKGIDTVKCGLTQGFNQALGGFLSGVLGPTTSASGCGGPYVSVADFNVYVSNQGEINRANKETWQTQREFNFAVNNTIATIGTQLDIINKTLASIADYMQYNNDYITYQAQVNSNTTAFVTTFARSVNAQFLAQQESIGTAFQQITGVTDSMAQIVNTTSSNFEKLTLALAVATTNLTNTLNSQAEQISFLNTNMVFNNLLVSTQLLKLQALFMNAYNNVQLKRDVAKIVQVSMAFQQSQGNVPFLDDLGVPPPADIYNLPPVLATTVVNVVTKQFLYTDTSFVGSNRPTLRSVEFAWKCSTGVVGQNPQLWGSYVDTLGALGPANCTGASGAGLQVCNCWIDVEDTQALMECQRPYPNEPTCFPVPGPCTNTCPDGTIPSSSALNFWANGLNPGITATIPGTSPAQYLVLQGNPNNILPGKFNGVRITSADQYLNISRELCDLGINQYYNLWVNGGGLGKGYRIYSAFNSTSMSAPYDATTCDLTLTEAMKPPTRGPFSTLYAEMQYAMTAYNMIIQTIDPTLLFGSIPNYLTYEQIPTATLSGGEVNTCWIIYYMVYDPITTGDSSTQPYYNSIPVSTLQFVSTTATVLLQVDNGPVQTYPAVSVNPSDILLPEDGFVILGDPLNMWTGEAGAYTFDPPQQILPLNPAKQGTCGTPIYMMMPSPFNLTRARWSESAGYSFDHRCGTSVPRLFQVTLADPGFGPQCDLTQPNSAATGRLCNILSRFTASASQTGTGIKTVIFRGYPGPTTGDTTQVSVIVPAGEIRNIVNTACPTSTQVITGSNTKAVIFTNGLTTNNRIQVERTGACPSIQIVTLPPLGASAPYTITFCPGTQIGESENLTVSTVDGNNQVIQECADVSVNVDVQQLGLLATAASFNTTQTYNLVAVDSVSTGLGAIQNELLLFQMNQIMNLYMSLPRAGIQLDQFAISNMTAVYNQILALNGASQDAYIVNQRRVVNYTGLITDYTDSYEFNAARQAEIAVLMGDKLQEVIAYNAALSQAGQVLDQQQIILAYLAGAVAQNVSTLAEYTDRPINYPGSGSDPLNVGDLLGEFGEGLGNGIGAAARGIANAAGTLIQALAMLPAALVGLITSTVGMVFLWIAVITAPLALVGLGISTYFLVKVIKDFNAFKDAAAAAGFVRPAAAAAPTTATAISVPSTQAAQSGFMAPVGIPVAGAPPAPGAAAAMSATAVMQPPPQDLMGLAMAQMPNINPTAGFGPSSRKMAGRSSRRSPNDRSDEEENDSREGATYGVGNSLLDSTE